MLLFRRGSARRGAVGICVAFALGGCMLTGTGQDDEVQGELDENRQKWEARAIGDYRFVARRICFCPQEVVAPVIVEVRAGAIESLRYQESGEPVDATYSSLWPSMNGVFDIIQDAIDRGAHQITVEYAPTFGYPTEIGIDYIREAVDDELGFRVESFETLP